MFLFLCINLIGGLVIGLLIVWADVAAHEKYRDTQRDLMKQYNRRHYGSKKRRPDDVD